MKLFSLIIILCSFSSAALASTKAEAIRCDSKGNKNGFASATLLQAALKPGNENSPNFKNVDPNNALIAN